MSSKGVEESTRSSYCPSITFEAENCTEWSKIAALKLGSLLTDPFCNTREYFYRLWVVSDMNPTDEKVVILVKQLILCVGVVVCAFIAIFATVPGGVCRYVANTIQEKPYFYFQGNAEEKKLNERAFTQFSWNICCPAGGYPITDGGVAPWSFRIDGIADKIHEQDADVVCLYELMDIDSAFTLFDKMKDNYAHFYFNIGPQAFSVNSGLFVASKFAIENPNFTAFPKDMLVGRTKNAEKGVFSFDLVSDEEIFARVFTTHPQQSEICAEPTEEEVEARRREMELVMREVDDVKAGRCVLLTGDLNLDANEFRASDWHQFFQVGFDINEDKTWGGDAFCATLMGKPVSGPLTYDYALLRNGRRIETSLIETGYDAAVFTREALSDHRGIFSQITY